MADPQLQSIVEKMVAAGEPEENIALVIQHYKAPAAPSAAAPAAPPDEKSLSGFLGNVVSSGGQFLKDTANGVVGAAKFLGDIAPGGDVNKAAARVDQIKQAVTNAPRIVSAAGQALKNRYGGIDQIKNTLYADPVGVAGDLSMVLDPAAGLAKAGGLVKTAETLSRAAELANPVRLATAPAEKLAHEAGVAAIRGTVRPPAALREDFGGSRAIADNILKDRVYSEASAGRKLDRSVAKADQLIADAQASAAPGVDAKTLAAAVLGEPQATAQLRTRLGVPDASPDLQDTANRIIANNNVEIPLTEAQQMKREAQKLAYEAGADNLTVKKAAETAKAKALRAGIEQSVPEVGPVNEQSQRLLGSKQAFAAAEDRPRGLTNFLSVLGGAGGFASAGPMGAAITPLLIKAMDSPRAGALAGIASDSVGRAVNSAAALKAALVARLMGQVPE